MAKKSARKAAAHKVSKSVTAKKSRKAAKKVAVKKSARAGGSHVNFGLHGVTRIMKPIHEAGLESEFDKAMGPDHSFVKVQRKSLDKLRSFVASKPQLAPVAREIEHCTCDPDDPYCIYIGQPA
jgi:hypothetical protein